MQEKHLISDWQTQAKQTCADANILMTPKRLEVYSALLKAGHPLSAYDLINAVHIDFGRQLTPISIYRILDFLKQKHLVRKLKSTGKYLTINLPPVKTSSKLHNI